MQTQQTYTQDIQAPLVSFIITTYNLPIQYLKELAWLETMVCK